LRELTRQSRALSSWSISFGLAWKKKQKNI
jgi:hypothetical protein